MNLFIRIFDFMSIAYNVVIGGFVIAVLIWMFGIRNTGERQNFKKIVMWTIFVLIVVVSMLILVGKFAISNLFGG